jgi:hypothetical protein
LIASATAIGSWERFEQIDLGGANIEGHRPTGKRVAPRAGGATPSTQRPSQTRPSPSPATSQTPGRSQLQQPNNHGADPAGQPQNASSRPGRTVWHGGRRRLSTLPSLSRGLPCQPTPRGPWAQ